MRLHLKTTGFALTPAWEETVREKILKPLERRAGKNFPEDLPVDVELAKVTRHHEEGKIWKCEVNLAWPHEKKTIYVEVVAESLEAAIDEAKDELELQVSENKGRWRAKFLRGARRIKEEFHITRLARRAGGVYPVTKNFGAKIYRWFRRRRPRA
ncbi:MAG: HPF/RaiA family ribosome-associated protein [bacterium]|nr:HPF/RaiA family ribosome-associated protein [bacterium]